ncbi:MAG: hypothetical protein MZV70_06645 [Desulfobacterales bacterium]|nr:hypothetical protein [Desulfobacterales bacterium]
MKGAKAHVQPAAGRPGTSAILTDIRAVHVQRRSTRRSGARRRKAPRPAKTELLARQPAAARGARHGRPHASPRCSTT